MADSIKQNTIKHLNSNVDVHSMSHPFDIYVVVHFIRWMENQILALVTN